MTSTLHIDAPAGDSSVGRTENVHHLLNVGEVQPDRFWPDPLPMGLSGAPALVASPTSDLADPVLDQCYRSVNTPREPATSPVTAHVPGYSSRFDGAEVDAIGTASPARIPLPPFTITTILEGDRHTRRNFMRRERDVLEVVAELHRYGRVLAMTIADAAGVEWEIEAGMLRAVGVRS